MRELQDRNIEQQQQHQHQHEEKLYQLQEGIVREVKLMWQLEIRYHKLKEQMESRERELHQQLKLLHNNVTGTKTTMMTLRVFKTFKEEIQYVATKFN